MGILIRTMKPSEVSTVQKISKRAFPGLEGLLVSKPKKALVAVKDGEIVGAVLYKFFQAGRKKIGYIDFAFIDPDYHNQGIGGQLYKASIEYLWEQGCDALTAAVKDDNVGSWGLFLKYGFTRVSLADMVRQLGVYGMLQQYFGTPFCFGNGMEYYVALRGRICPSGKGGSFKQIGTYLVANLFLFLVILLRDPQNILTFLMAYLIFLAGGILAGYIGTLLSKRKWLFRHNNGGALICALVNFVGMYPMIGNWYPDRYENSDGFRRDMGITSLFGWIFALSLTLIPSLGITQHVIFRYIEQIGFVFLIFRILIFYPFESFGGKRVYQWNRWVYLLMTVLSISVLYVIIART